MQLELNSKQVQKARERILKPNTQFIASKESFKALLIDCTKPVISHNYRDFLCTL